jgi:sortase A
MSRRIVRWTERTLLVAGASLIAVWTAVTLEARLYGIRQERRLEALVDAEAAPEAPASRPGPRPARSKVRRASLAPDDLVGRIEIPRLGLKAVVAEGVSARTLRLAVGHLPGTALPGDDGGNVVLAGHRDTFFRPLKDVEPGDEVTLTTPQGRFRYSVESAVVVDPESTDVLEPAGEPVLTLITCYPFYLVGNAPDRFVVRAVRER